MIREVFPGIGFERIKRKTYGKDKSSRRRDYSHKCKRRRLHFITDMLKAKDGDFFVTDWLRNRNTMEFLGVWERVYNPKFNYGEFATIRNQSGLNSFKISVKEFVARTGAISLQAKAGRYGGTYAHAQINTSSCFSCEGRGVKACFHCQGKGCFFCSNTGLEKCSSCDGRGWNQY